MNELIYKIVDCVVEVGQSDKQFKLGETIRYKPSELLEILKEHETEIFAEPERNTGKWEIQVEQPNTFSPGGNPVYACSECGWVYGVPLDIEPEYNYCPHCGSYNGG